MGPVNDHIWKGSSQEIFKERFYEMEAGGVLDGDPDRGERFYKYSLAKIDDIKNNLQLYPERDGGYRVASYRIPVSMDRLIVYKIGVHAGQAAMEVYDVGARYFIP